MLWSLNKMIANDTSCLKLQCSAGTWLVIQFNTVSVLPRSLCFTFYELSNVYTQRERETETETGMGGGGGGGERERGNSL